MQLRRNKEITSDKVRVIASDGTQLGILQTTMAISMASLKGLDLIEISSGNPPVCKIMDYNKVLFEMRKKEKEDKRKQRENSRMKEVQLHPAIAPGDLKTKTKAIKNFLADGVRVKIIMSFRGREMSHYQVGESVMNTLKSEIESLSVIESFKKDGNSILMNVRAK